MVELLVGRMLVLVDVRPVFQKKLFLANLPHGNRSVDGDIQSITCNLDPVFLFTKTPS